VQRGVQHVVGEGADEPGPFGQGDEVVGRDQAAFGVLPAHQRLHPQHLAGVGVDLGLIVQHQLLVGVAQAAQPVSLPGSPVGAGGCPQRKPSQDHQHSGQPSSRQPSDGPPLRPLLVHAALSLSESRRVAVRDLG
jgi:hypothetical protein